MNNWMLLPAGSKVVRSDDEGDFYAVVAMRASDDMADDGYPHVEFICDDGALFVADKSTLSRNGRTFSRYEIRLGGVA